MKRISTERRMNDDRFTLKIGSVNKKNPEAIYLEGGVYLKPLTIEPTYKGLVKNLCKNIKRSVYSDVFFEPALTNDNIMEVEIAGDRVQADRKTLLTFQCFIKQKEPFLTVEELHKKPAPYINKILDTIEREITESGFSMSKTKR